MNLHLLEINPGKECEKMVSKSVVQVFCTCLPALRSVEDVNIPPVDSSSTDLMSELGFRCYENHDGVSLSSFCVCTEENIEKKDSSIVLRLGVTHHSYVSFCRGWFGGQSVSFRIISYPDQT